MLNVHLVASCQASHQFEAAAKLFIVATINATRELRPGCKVGSYGYPRNNLPFIRSASYDRWCAQQTEGVCFFAGYADDANGDAQRRLNDKLLWMWDALDAITPSIYLGIEEHETTDEAAREYVTETVAEAVRLADLVEGSGGARPEVLPFTWHLVNNYWQEKTGPRAALTLNQSRAQYIVPREAGADGVLMWGSVCGVPTIHQGGPVCQDLANTTQGAAGHQQWMDSTLQAVIKELDAEASDDGSVPPATGCSEVDEREAYLTPPAHVPAHSSGGSLGSLVVCHQASVGGAWTQQLLGGGSVISNTADSVGVAESERTFVPGVAVRAPASDGSLAVAKITPTRLSWCAIGATPIKVTLSAGMARVAAARARSALAQNTTLALTGGALLLGLARPGRCNTHRGVAFTAAIDPATGTARPSLLRVASATKSRIAAQASGAYSVCFSEDGGASWFEQTTAGVGATMTGAEHTAEDTSASATRGDAGGPVARYTFDGPVCGAFVRDVSASGVDAAGLFVASGGAQHKLPGCVVGKGKGLRTNDVAEEDRGVFDHLHQYRAGATPDGPGVVPNVGNDGRGAMVLPKALLATPDWTLSFWVSARDLSRVASLFSKGAHPSGSADAPRATMSINNGYLYGMVLGKNMRAKLSDAGLDLNTWTQLAMTLDSGTNAATMFVAGRAVASVTGVVGRLSSGTDADTSNTNHLLFPGLVGTAPHHQFEGEYDEIRVYDRALAGPEMAALGSASFYETEPQPPVVSAGVSQTIWPSAREVAANEVTVDLRGTAERSVKSEWVAVASPGLCGATASAMAIRDAAVTIDAGGSGVATVAATADLTAGPGAYTFELRATSAAGLHRRARVTVLVFEADHTTAGAFTPPAVPESVSRWCRHRKTTYNVSCSAHRGVGGYTMAELKKYKIDQELDPVKYALDGFAAHRFGPALPAHAHPRLAADRHSLTGIRQRFASDPVAAPLAQSFGARVYLDLFGAPLQRGTPASAGTASATAPAAIVALGTFRPPLDTFRSAILNTPQKCHLKPGNDQNGFNDLGEELVYAALFAMVHADSDAGLVLAEWLTRQAEFIALHSVEDLGVDSWQSRNHDLVGRYAVAVMYDLLHPWMDAHQRAVVRAVLAKATEGSWSIGMEQLPGYDGFASNWLPWVTGDLAMNILAIQGEQGFDQNVLDGVARAYTGFITLGTDPLSGAMYEGMGKNSMSPQNLMVMTKQLSELRMPSIASRGAKAHVKRFLLHMMLPDGHHVVEEDLLGGARGKVVNKKSECA